MTIPVLCTLGHVATFHALRALAISRARIDRAVASGRIVRARRGTYACTHVDEITRIAARVGGAITCVSALRMSGVWAGHSHEAHLQFRPDARASSAPNVRPHWVRPRFGMETPWRASRLQSLWQAITCLDAENALAALESAIHENFLPESQVRDLIQSSPRRLQPTFGYLEPKSGSGNETIVRLRLQSEGHVVTVQSAAPGMGHQDLVVDDCLGIDVDGRQWRGEDRFAIDRDRDLHAEGLGRHTAPRLESRRRFIEEPDFVQRAGSS